MNACVRNEKLLTVWRMSWLGLLAPAQSFFMRLWRRSWCRRRPIAGHGVCGRWIAVVSLPFDESVVHERGRALERVSGWRVAGDCLSADGAHQISRLRISNGGLRQEHGDCAISIETTGGHSNLRLPENENGRNASVRQRAVLEGHRAVLV